MGETIALWVPLVVAVLGVLGTIIAGVSGVVITQRWSDRRETRTAERERQRGQERWERERDREHERWAREDIARTFEQRRDAYSGFYESLTEMTLAIYKHGTGANDRPLEDDPALGDPMPLEFEMPTYRKLQNLVLYASPAVSIAAQNAYNNARSWGIFTEWGGENEEFDAKLKVYDRSAKQLLELIRKDLAVDSPTSGTVDT